MSSCLEDELGVPAEATLLDPATTSSQNEWTLTTNGITSIAVSVESAIRSNPRCLVVGRQAEAADIRIQHGSISRRHAALFLLPHNDKSVLILQDFGSKKGTLVNGEPVKGRRVLQEGDEIIFGCVRENAFRISCLASTKQAENNGQFSYGLSQSPEKSIVEEESAPTREKDTTQPGPDTVLTGRAKREAEIAAMMESLGETPIYKKYTPLAEQMPRNAAISNSGSFGTRGHSERTPSASPDNQDKLDQISCTARRYKLPISERMSLDTDDGSDRNHLVTCIAVDPAGARFVVGNTDKTLRLYDFAGMDRLRRDPFKLMLADEGHVVSDVCYSNTGDRILVGTGSVQPYVLDRDGTEM